jgi:hypothetical protein
MDTIVWILFILNIASNILSLLASGFRYSTTVTTQITIDSKERASAHFPKTPFFGKPMWVRFVSGLMAVLLLYVLNGVYSSNPPPNVQTMILVAMIFAFLCFTLFSWILFEISLKATKWIEWIVSNSLKTMRFERNRSVESLKEDFRNDIKHSKETLDKVVPIVRFFLNRARKNPIDLLVDKELKDLPSI